MKARELPIFSATKDLLIQSRYWISFPICDTLAKEIKVRLNVTSSVYCDTLLWPWKVVEREKTKMEKKKVQCPFLLFTTSNW